jgi:membrane-associated phospholipid phosphatase
MFALVRFPLAPARLSCALVLAAASVAPSAARADEVIRWNRVATMATAAADTDPLTESRIFAILHAAIHDAVNGVERRYTPYRESTLVATDASPDAAAASAAHVVLSTLVPGARTTFDAALSEALGAVPAGAARDAGVAAGRQAADLVLSARANDGSAAQVAWTAGTKPGEYRPTPPQNYPAFMPQWGRIEPFVLASSAQFRPVPHPALASDAYAAGLAEVQRLGAEASRVRTPEQSEIAKYWYEHSTQGWNRIAREVSASRHLGLWENARLFALVNLAMADGFIAGFEAKYHYNFWRPVTAIREAAGDGNERTMSEAAWKTFLDTPPVPDYPSTHTVLGAAAAAVLARFFDTDLVSFTMTSGAPYAGLTRHFWSFAEAAQENGASRVLAGIHFPFAVKAGYEQGSAVGTWVFEHALQPTKATPTSTARR